MLPMHEWAVAERAPGKLAMEGAPMDRARTTARAEFCIPVSMEIVREVRSPKPRNFRGTRYPARKPTAWRPSTEDTIKGISPTPPAEVVEARSGVFSATTPPLWVGKDHDHEARKTRIHQKAI